MSKIREVIKRSVNMGRDVAQLVERQTYNLKVVGLSPGGIYHQSLVSPFQKLWSSAGSGQTINSESKSGSVGDSDHERVSWSLNIQG